MKGEFWCGSCGRYVPQWQVSRSDVGFRKNMCERCAKRTAYSVTWIRQLGGWVSGAGLLRTIVGEAEQKKSEFLALDTGRSSFPHLDLHANLEKDVWSLRCLYPDQWQTQGSGPEELEERLIMLRNEHGGHEKDAALGGLIRLKSQKVIKREK
jgi:hypothetical protein